MIVKHNFLIMQNFKKFQEQNNFRGGEFEKNPGSIYKLQLYV